MRTPWAAVCSATAAGSAGPPAVRALVPRRNATWSPDEGDGARAEERERERLIGGCASCVALREQAGALLRAHVDVDVGVWAVLDPATLMWASCVLDGMPGDAELENGVFADEYGQPDVLKLVDLAGGPTAGTLSQATAGDPARSRRFRQLLAPRGFSDELRLLLTDGGSS